MAATKVSTLRRINRGQRDTINIIDKMIDAFQTNQGKKPGLVRLYPEDYQRIKEIFDKDRKPRATDETDPRTCYFEYKEAEYGSGQYCWFYRDVKIVGYQGDIA